MRKNSNASRGAWRILLVVTFGAGVVFTAHAQQTETESAMQRDLTELLQRQADAWNAGKLEEFMDTYWRSERLTFSSGGATTRGWQATLDRYRERYPDKEAMGKLQFSELETMSLGDGAALMLGRWHLVASGKPYGGNFSLVWRKIEGDWKIVHDHTSSSTPTNPAPSSSDQRR